MSVHAQRVATHRGLFIDGEHRPARHADTFDSRAPATGATIATLIAGSTAEVERAVASARQAFADGRWKSLGPEQRKATLLAIAEAIDAHLEELALLDAVEAGKPISDCEDGDVPDAARAFRWYAEAIDKVYGRIAPGARDHLALITREPIGVVGLVLPWNFPLATLAMKIAPALAAGNSVVVKPSEEASMSTLRLAELAVEAGLPAGVFNVVTGRGNEAGRALGLHPDVDVVSFTGSTAVGREFLRYAADSNLKRIVLELGGKSPQIVTAGAADDLETIAHDLTEAAFWNAGQNCTAGSRVLVDNGLKGDLVSLLSAAAAKIRVGDPLDRETTMGPVINRAALTRIDRAVRDALDEGAALAAGGTPLHQESGGCYFAPTVLVDVDPSSTLARAEIFGPVLAVFGFDSEEEAIRLANDTEYGLAATVWTHDIDQAIRMSRAVAAGTVAVNGYSEGDVTTPFGGWKQSGFGGRDNGLEAFDQYTELKTVWITLR